MFSGKKIMLVATTDNMIWQFLLPHINYMIKAGNTVDCYCTKTGFWFDDMKEKYGLNVIDIPFTRSPFSIKNIKGYNQLVANEKDKKYDLVYCQQPVGGVMGRLIAKKFKIPCIYTAHGFHFYKGCPLMYKLLFKPVEKYCAKYTTALVTMNEEDYQNAQKFKAKKVYKINGIGVDLSKYKKNEKLDAKAFRAQFGIAPDDFVITSIGELNKNKNTLRLIDVMSQISNPKIKYLICGQGPLKEDYEKAIAKYNLQDRVKMLGFRKDIPDILTITDLYIMPSYREGLPKSMMEAMCYGLPVVASKIRGNMDLIGENEGGILFDPTRNAEIIDSIMQIYEDKALRNKFSKRNAEFIKNYDTSVVIDQLEKIYEEM